MATLKDIAKACNMDISTVSRGLRDDPRVKEETRERIRRVAEKLGYSPNSAARSLVGARTRTVWFLMPGIADDLAQLAVDNSSRYLADNGYDLSVMLYHGQPQRYIHLLRRLQHGITDAAIIIPGPLGQGAPEFAALADQSFPLVFVDRYPSFAAQPIVTSDNAACARKLAEALVESGAERFILAYRDGLNTVEEARLHGTLAYLGENGIPFAFRNSFTNSFLDGAQRIAVIGTLQRDVVGFCEQHQEVITGKEVQFGVFDRWHGDPYPAVSTVYCKQDFAAMARKAVDLVLGMIDGDDISADIHKIPPASMERIDTRVQR